MNLKPGSLTSKWMWKGLQWKLYLSGLLRILKPLKISKISIFQSIMKDL